MNALSLQIREFPSIFPSGGLISSRTAAAMARPPVHPYAPPAVHPAGTENFMTALACTELESCRPPRSASGCPPGPRAADSGYVSPSVVNDAWTGLPGRAGQLRQLRTAGQLPGNARRDDLVHQLGRDQRLQLRRHGGPLPGLAAVIRRGNRPPRGWAGIGAGTATHVGDSPFLRPGNGGNTAWVATTSNAVTRAAASGGMAADLMLKPGAWRSAFMAAATHWQLVAILGCYSRR